MNQPPLTNALITMAKRPAPGQTKTRLTPPLTPENAALLYECFLKDTLSLMRQVPDTQPIIAFSPAAEKPYFTRLAPDFELILQLGDDLGERLAHNSSEMLNAGYARVVLIGSDSPTLPVAYVNNALEMLSGSSDIVLGPSDDGGYYLIGLKQPAPRLFLDVRMSTPNVLTDTQAIANELGLRVELLPQWYDVDDAESLTRLDADLVGMPETVAPHTRAFKFNL